MSVRSIAPLTIFCLGRGYLSGLVRRWSLDIVQDPRWKVPRGAYAASNERVVASSPHPPNFRMANGQTGRARHPTQEMISPELKSAGSLKCLISALC